LIGKFKKIKVSYLPVGHTHEDIDRTFSVFRPKMYGKTFLTPSAFNKWLGSLYKDLVIFLYNNNTTKKSNKIKH